MSHLEPVEMTLQPHMIQTIALQLITEWKEKEHLKTLYPLENFDHVTAVQIFNKLDLNRVSDILNEIDNEYLKNHLFKNSKFDVAKCYVLTGYLPKRF